MKSPSHLTTFAINGELLKGDHAEFVAMEFDNDLRFKRVPTNDTTFSARSGKSSRMFTESKNVCRCWNKFKKLFK
jgi:hypothetical protein